ncbi:nitrogen regulation protein NtrY, putative [Shewanella violacea DSS12]|uniref:histidine kinase n=2 Tax=Shewanella violacea TaxID=60217 RepID=D4ZG43_SHEVD|nr:nitrogen regulation protein NtrY, putative [Shewanella violacea DSS12]
MMDDCAMTLRSKLILASVLACFLGLVSAGLLFNWLGQDYLVLIALLSLGLVWAVSHYMTRNLADCLAALEVGLLNFKDNDFSISIPVKGDEQLRTLARLFNESAHTLRRERQFIYQRELLLDKVIQSSPNVMILLDDEQRVIYANDAARHLFNQGVPIEGLHLHELIEACSPELITALNNPKDGLFTLGAKESLGTDIQGETSDETMNEDETWHLSRGRFKLNGQLHHLLLLKQMTHELNRQEVAVWKKVIRIISHELNNSVAPIASMVNSGRMITKDLNDPKLKMIFDTIDDRTQHLSQFIFNYARFAKLPLPNKSMVNWLKMTEHLSHHYKFTLDGSLPEGDGYFDLIQMEQVLLNLLKNAHESGSKVDEITMSITQANPSHGVDSASGNKGILISICDAGSGMSSEVLKQALLPFYSTKQSGTGLGLPLCREILEAHDGRISLHNREETGLCVKLWLPQS